MKASPSPTHRQPTWLRILVWVLLIALVCYTFFYLLSGFQAGYTYTRADLITRWREYDVFRKGLYPMPELVPQPVPQDLPFSVYPPYAQPMFGLFFGFGGLAQGWKVVHALSLLSLFLIGWIGWRSLRFAGPAAGLLGAIAPVAISGNSYSLYQGQFSILCMGLISLQWLLLERRRPLAAGLCWAGAMLKPQIALFFAVPFLKRGNRRGLVLGLSLLLLLSGAALAFTKVSPLRYISAWLNPNRFAFVRAGNVNLMNLPGPGLTLLLLLVVLGCVLASRWGLAKTRSLPIRRPQFPAEPKSMASTLRTQGICAVFGCLVVYHHPYDNIMLYPALLAIVTQALQERRLWSRLLALAMALSLWAPVHLVATQTLFQSLAAGIWMLVGVTLLAHRPERWREGTQASIS